MKVHWNSLLFTKNFSIFSIKIKKRRKQNDVNVKIYFLNKIRSFVARSGLEVVHELNRDKNKCDSMDDDKYVVDNPISIDFIEDFLFIGNATAASDTKTLDRLSIR